MATIYIADETKLLLDKLSEADRGRPLVDVVGFLVEERAKQLGILADTTPSTEEIKTTNPNTNSQAELSQKESETLKNQ